MRIPLSQLDPANVSRTTLWRARKRGWARIPGAQKTEPARKVRRYVEAVNLAAFNSVPFAVLQNEAERVANTLHLSAFPRWLDRSDLVQEALLHLLRRSALAGFNDPAWRTVVMRNRLLDLSRKRRELPLPLWRETQ